MEIQTENGLKEVFSYLETGNPDKARRIVAHLLEIDSTRNEFVFTSTCCNLWSNTTFRILQIESPFERGENLLSEWKSFKSYVNRQKYVYEPTVYAIQKGVFTSALQNFMQVIDEKDTTHKSEIYRKIGHREMVRRMDFVMYRQKNTVLGKKMSRNHKFCGETCIQYSYDDMA